MSKSVDTLEGRYFRHLERLRKPTFLERVGRRRSVAAASSRYDEARRSIVRRAEVRGYTGSEHYSTFLVMVEWQAFLTTVVAEIARDRSASMDESQLVVWSLGRMANQILHGIRHAFLDTVFPAVAAGIRCLLEVIATIDFVLESDDNIRRFLNTDSESDPVRIPFQRMLREAGKQDGLPWIDLYEMYSENTHPKLSILKTAWRESSKEPERIGLAMDDEWHPDDFEAHWESTRLCLDRIATAMIGYFELDPILLKRLDQLSQENLVFEEVAE
jgi:hypothetical protein